MTAAAGSLKQTVGKALGNESMQCEGAGKKAQGNAEVDAAKAKGYAEGTGEKLSGNIKSGVGSMIGNKSMEAKGEYNKAHGASLQEANK